MACFDQNGTSNVPTIFREVERYNLFSQGNIYTTKIVNHPIQESSTPYLGHRSASLLVGTLKPPKILSITVPNMESNNPLEPIKDEGINIKVIIL